MVPLPRYSTVAGIPLPDLFAKERIDSIVSERGRAARRLVNLLKTGSAYYAPSAAAVEMVEAILKDKKRFCLARYIWKASTGLRIGLWACR